eukprot:4254169-Pleurochrysis_carterae.AAC.1
MWASATARQWDWARLWRAWGLWFRDDVGTPSETFRVQTDRRELLGATILTRTHEGFPSITLRAGSLVQQFNPFHAGA